MRENASIMPVGKKSKLDMQWNMRVRVRVFKFEFEFVKVRVGFCLLSFRVAVLLLFFDFVFFAFCSLVCICFHNDWCGVCVTCFFNKRHGTTIEDRWRSARKTNDDGEVRGKETFEIGDRELSIEDGDDMMGAIACTVFVG